MKVDWILKITFLSGLFEHFLFPVPWMVQVWFVWELSLTPFWNKPKVTVKNKFEFTWLIIVLLPSNQNLPYTKCTERQQVCQDQRQDKKVLLAFLWKFEYLVINIIWLDQGDREPKLRVKFLPSKQLSISTSSNREFDMWLLPAKLIPIHEKLP